ncbi:hypothetical protein CEXT_457381 [Caerostris extrusa]|uniref:Uncharacterized protein n=1 Tax=Caerostris extrusa TaxID=172846 RepID=A0AAV4W8B1_CAEEX|nr:hypothetical protein CEXT_457381 [Caerostris extrusa]
MKPTFYSKRIHPTVKRILFMRGREKIFKGLSVTRCIQPHKNNDLCTFGHDTDNKVRRMIFGRRRQVIYRLRVGEDLDNPSSFIIFSF